MIVPDYTCAYFAMVCTPALLRSVYSGATALRCARDEQ
jgi:hypothetical protein